MTIICSFFCVGAAASELIANRKKREIRIRKFLIQYSSENPYLLNLKAGSYLVNKSISNIDAWPFALMYHLPKTI
jgi:hypothetical protein